MSASILERLDARIAAEPAIADIETLFADLQDARNTIAAAVAQNTSLKDMLSSGVTPPEAHIVAGAGVEEAITLLKDAQERLAVNALSDVGIYVERAINLLGG